METDSYRGLILSFGTFFGYYDNIFLLSTMSWKINFIGSMQTFLALGLSFVMGRLVDARMHRQLAFVGGLLVTTAHLCLSFTSRHNGENEGNFGLMLLTQGVMGGLGVACYFVYSSQLAVQVRPTPQWSEALRVRVLILTTS